MEEILLAHFAAYPAMTPQDGVKLLYQSAFGPGHLLADPDRALTFLRRELEETLPAPGPLYEPIGGGYARLQLAAARDAGLSAETIFREFSRAAESPCPGSAAFEDGLALLERLAARDTAPFSADGLAAYLREYRAAGCPMVSHSPVYREHYHPAYRVVFAPRPLHII